MSKLLNPKPYHTKCWHCDGTGQAFRPLLDGQGAIKGYAQGKCLVCYGKGVVPKQKEVAA